MADLASTKCCLMDAGTSVRNQRTELCTDPADGFAGTTHQKGKLDGGFYWQNDQSILHNGKSCWEVIASCRWTSPLTAA